jgi:3',5'-cyclic AMP phosphodiesterase CpdA
MLIAQLSDLHIRPRGKLYKGVVESNRLAAAAIEHVMNLDRRPDLVVLSGDLTEKGHPDEYAMALELLGGLSMPWLVMPGNHDERENFRATFAGRGHAYLPASGPLHYVVDEYPVRIVALDSCPPGQHHGHIDAAGLDWLQATLAEQPLKPTLVLLHHPPFMSGIGYLDDYRYIDAEPLAAVIRGYSNIEAVLCGHVHRAMVKRWAGTVVMACPSTATEIALRLEPGASPQSFLGPTACLLHLWHPDHGVVSHTSYIGQYPGPYPFF